MFRPTDEKGYGLFPEIHNALKALKASPPQRGSPNQQPRAERALRASPWVIEEQESKH
jgi:hypothetical protein